jgi:3-hydroxymyristoyl/3-hydroxydecanoyl-(acyl carrier protein) dehydratase
VVHAEGNEEAFTARVRFPRDLDVFLGHFPGMPLVPGVFLIEAVRCGAERALGKSLRIVRVSDAKFTAEVKPDAELTVDAVLTGESCSAVLRLPGGEAARVRLVLQPAT